MCAPSQASSLETFTSSASPCKAQPHPKPLAVLQPRRFQQGTMPCSSWAQGCVCLTTWHIDGLISQTATTVYTHNTNCYHCYYCCVSLTVVCVQGLHGHVSDAAAEQSLVSQQVLVLPDSGAVVVPLKHDSMLVGLLVLERAGPAPPDPSREWVPIDQGHSGRSVDVSMDESDSSDSPDGGATAPWGAGGVLTSEVQWGAVCDVAASLSSACTLEQRATLELAYHMAGRSSLQGLVAEVSQPLRTLRTLGALLAPRVGDETGNRDMVEGIMAQGDRLQQVVRGKRRVENQLL